MKKNKILSFTLGLGLLVNSTLLFNNVKANELTQEQIITIATEKLQEFKSCPVFSTYNKCYEELCKINDQAIREKLGAEIAPYWNKVATPYVLDGLKRMESLGNDKNLLTFNELMTEIKNSSLKTEEDGKFNEGYLLGELDAWARSGSLYTKEECAAIDKIVETWTNKTEDNVKACEELIAKVAHPKSRQWLQGEVENIKKLMKKVDKPVVDSKEDNKNEEQPVVKPVEEKPVIENKEDKGKLIYTNPFDGKEYYEKDIADAKEAKEKAERELADNKAKEQAEAKKIEESKKEGVKLTSEQLTTLYNAKFNTNCYTGVKRAWFDDMFDKWTKGELTVDRMTEDNGYIISKDEYNLNKAWVEPSSDRWACCKAHFANNIKKVTLDYTDDLDKLHSELGKAGFNDENVPTANHYENYKFIINGDKIEVYGFLIGIGKCAEPDAVRVEGSAEDIQNQKDMLEGPITIEP